LAELDSSLLNLLQNSEVQSPRLQIHEAVLKQLEESQNDVGEAIAQIPDNILHNSGILNKLQAMANDWIRQIREFTKQADERPVGSATQEKNFWLATESAIESIEEQLAGPGVQLTMRKRQSVIV
jgi:dynein heavy chain 1